MSRSPPPPQIKVEGSPLEEYRQLTYSPEGLPAFSVYPPPSQAVLDMLSAGGYPAGTAGLLRPSMRLSPVQRQQPVFVSQPGPIPILRGHGLSPVILPPPSGSHLGMTPLTLRVPSPSVSPSILHMLSSASPSGPPRVSPAVSPADRHRYSPSQSPKVSRRPAPSSRATNHSGAPGEPVPFSAAYLHTSAASASYGMSPSGAGLLKPAATRTPPGAYHRTSPVPSHGLRAPSPIPPAHYRTSPVPTAHSRVSPVPAAHMRTSPAPSAHFMGSPVPSAHSRTSPAPNAYARTSPAPNMHQRTTPSPVAHQRTSPAPPSSHYRPLSNPLPPPHRASPQPPTSVWVNASAVQPRVTSNPGSALPVDRDTGKLRVSPGPGSHLRASPVPTRPSSHHASPASHRTSPAPPSHRTSPAPPSHRSSPAPHAALRAAIEREIQIPRTPVCTIPIDHTSLAMPINMGNGSMHRPSPIPMGRDTTSTPPQGPMIKTKAQLKAGFGGGPMPVQVYVSTIKDEPTETNNNLDSASAASSVRVASDALAQLLRMKNNQQLIQAANKNSSEIISIQSQERASNLSRLAHAQPLLAQQLTQSGPRSVQAYDPSGRGNQPPPLLPFQSTQRPGDVSAGGTVGRALPDVTALGHRAKREEDAGAQPEVRRRSADAMPRLMPETMSLHITNNPVIHNGGNAPPKEETVKVEEDTKTEAIENPFNMRSVTLNNWPPANQAAYRTTSRAQALAICRAKAGCITNPARSLELVRENLQKFINKDIDDIIQKYMEEFFRPGIENIQMNNGDGAVTDDHIKGVCGQILEEAKKMYQVDTRSGTPDHMDAGSDHGSMRSGSLAENKAVRQKKISLFNIRKRRGSSDSDNSGVTKKRKGRPPIRLQGTLTGRSTPVKQGKLDSVRREGPKWDPSRLQTSTHFVMGARANKALGHGSQRGRVYIKHPDIFKYSGDGDDKVWLYENHHMPATGGKAYLLLVEDITELAQTDEYRNNPEVQCDVPGFAVPEWMLEKMRIQMQVLRTDLPKPTRQKPVLPRISGQMDEDGRLPFSSLSSSADKSLPDNASDNQPSPCPTDTMDEDPPSVSPLHMTGGFGDPGSPPDVSPAPSDLDNMDDDLNDPPAFPESWTKHSN